MAKQKNSSFLKRLSYAQKGIVEAWKRESSIRIQFGAAAALLVFCLIVRPSAIWCALFAAMTSLVLALELVNSAMESILDKLHPKHDEEIGFAKDCLAGSVLIASIAALIVFACYVVTRFELGV